MCSMEVVEKVWVAVFPFLCYNSCCELVYIFEHVDVFLKVRIPDCSTVIEFGEGYSPVYLMSDTRRCFRCSVRWMKPRRCLAFLEVASIWEDHLRSLRNTTPRYFTVSEGISIG